jgi:predicted Zn finger-like uncharacterized protein
MNLATRCLSCGTVFRVAESQLLASDGWVRCGRCNSVFNAAEVLFDIDSGAPMRLASPPDEAAPHADALPSPPARPAAAQADRLEPRFDDRPQRADSDEPLLRAPSREHDERPDEPIVITDHVPPPAPPAPSADDGPALAPMATAVADAPEPALVATGASLPPPTPAVSQVAPSFLRQADRAARWQHPAMRSGLWVGVLLLALAAGLQMALLWRDTLAAHLPRTAPALQALCRLAGCSVQPLRRIQQLSVESSGLNRLEGSSLYRLQLVLRNRADTSVMLPALDLSLTDPQGLLVARRVLPVAELGVTQTALQAGQELPIKVLMSTGERRVDGYTLELFYP